MVEENIRSRGVVVRFNEQKGYGFIKPDDGSDDLFVHHTEIKSDDLFFLLIDKYFVSQFLYSLILGFQLVLDLLWHRIQTVPATAE